MPQDHPPKHTPRDADADADGAPDSDSDDSLFKALEEEDDSAYRAHRIEQLNAEFASAKNNQSQQDGGPTLLRDTLYPTITSDQTLLDFTTQSARCVIHFAHPDFARCATMDEHIRALATTHHDVRFARVDVRHTPFVVEKLKIRVLPCVIGFKDGVGVERVVGFEGLGGGGDRFSTTTLEKRLASKGVLTEARLKGGDGESEVDSEEVDEDGGGGFRRRAIRTGNRRAGRNDDEDEDDWD